MNQDRASFCAFAILAAAFFGPFWERANAAAPPAASSPASPAGPVVIYSKESPPSTPKLEDLLQVESLSQYGITWTFDKPARAGKFLTGDWYVVGPVTVKAIDPKPLFGDEVKNAPETKGKCTEGSYAGAYARNGSTLNMPAVVPRNKVTPRTSRSGFDSRMDMAAYDENQFTKLPIAMKAGDSLVSSASAEAYTGYPIKAVAILTCVAAPQPPDAFRPSYCQSATCRPYLARDLRRDLLLKLPKPAGAAKVKPADYAGIGFFQDPWIDTVGFGRAMPRKNFQFYGPQIAELGGDCSLLLLLDYTPQEKEPLLVNMIQVAIDLHGLVRGGANWTAEGGGAAGRKWPIVFAGLMLDDPNMHSLTKAFPDTRFHEDGQTAFGPVTFNGKKYERSWTGAKVIWTGHYGYYNGQFRGQEGKALNSYSPVDLFPPSEWPSPWNVGSESYRRGMTSTAWVAEALAARLMHAEKLWDHDAFFAYVDRWMTEDDTKVLGEMMKNAEAKLAAAKTEAEKKALEDDKAKIAAAIKGGTITGRTELAPIVKELWDKYRNNPPDGTKVPAAETTWK